MGLFHVCGLPSVRCFPYVRLNYSPRDFVIRNERSLSLLVDWLTCVMVVKKWWKCFGTCVQDTTPDRTTSFNEPLPVQCTAVKPAVNGFPCRPWRLALDKIHVAHDNRPKAF